MHDGNRDTKRSGALRRLFAERPAVVIGPVLVVLLGIGLASVVAVAATGDKTAAPMWQAPGSSQPSSAAGARPTSTGRPASTAKVISMSATGDIIMGNAPRRLPANGGEGFFDSVKQALAADLVMGNLEEPLTDDTGTAKCAADSTGCHQFRAPPSYAGHLRDAGFMLLNQANNHSNDYGPAGYRNTQKALEEHGLKHTGALGEITVVNVEGVKVAAVGFSSYGWSNSLIDIDSAKRVVAKAVTMADLVVVQAHMGAEGSDKIHVQPGTEMFLGENRGDPVKFSHTMIDAGADLVVGHGPHVLRALEFYKGRLIAYSLGNFAGGGGTLSNTGRLGLSGVLKVSLTADGEWAGGQLLAIYLTSAGKPTMDPGRRSLSLVRDLCRSDFLSTGAKIDASGKISAPAAG